MCKLARKCSVLTIKVISPKVRQSLFKALLDPVMPRSPQLAGYLSLRGKTRERSDRQLVQKCANNREIATHKNLRPRDTRGTNSFSNFFLVPISPTISAGSAIERNSTLQRWIPCTIYMSIPCFLNGMSHGRRNVARLRLPGSCRDVNHPVRAV